MNTSREIADLLASRPSPTASDAERAEWFERKARVLDLIAADNTAEGLTDEAASASQAATRARAEAARLRGGRS